jgi:chromosome segregation ATPase
MLSDGSDDVTGTNQEPEGGGTPEGAGGGQEDIMDKVTSVLRETVGVDLDAVIEEREAAAAKAAAEDVGKKAQKTYDPKITALEKQLQSLSAELTEARKTSRLAEIAALPEDKQEAAKKIFEAEETVRDLGQMRQGLNMAAKTLAAEKTALELQKQGITAEAADFDDCETPADMEARAAKLRVAELERQLKEAKEGKAEPEKGKQPPAASQKAAPQKGATGSAPGTKPWEAQTKKGFNKLADALRAMREAGSTGE